MYRLKQTFKFDAAHHLPNHQGRCRNVHGHTYTLEVNLVAEELDDHGMVIDFIDLKKIVDKNILKKFDHSDLNEIIENPTAENIAKYAYDALENELNKGNHSLDSITIEETQGNSVTYKKS